MQRSEVYYIAMIENEKPSFLPKAGKQQKYYLKKSKRVKWVTEQTNPNNRKEFYTLQGAEEYMNKGAFARDVLNNHDGFQLQIEKVTLTVVSVID